MLMKRLGLCGCPTGIPPGPVQCVRHPFCPVGPPEMSLWWPTDTRPATWTIKFSIWHKMKFIAGNRRVKQTLPRYFDRVAILKDTTRKEVSVTSRSLRLLFLENDVFFRFDTCMESRPSKSVEKTLTFKISLKRIFTSSSVIEYL